MEDEDAPLFPNLDNELTPVEAAEDNLINSEVLLPVGDFHELTRVLHQICDSNSMQIVTLHSIFWVATTKSLTSDMSF